MNNIKKKSGLKLNGSDLSWQDLIKMCQSYEHDYNLFLDIQSEMLDEVWDASSFQKVRKMMIELSMESDRKTYFHSFEAWPNEKIDPAMVIMTLRLQAASELNSRRWMNDVMLAGMAYDDVLPAYGKFCVSSELEYSSNLNGLVFNDATAQRQLSHLGSSARQ